MLSKGFTFSFCVKQILFCRIEDFSPSVDETVNMIYNSNCRAKLTFRLYQWLPISRESATIKDIISERLKSEVIDNDKAKTDFTI